MLKVQLHFMLVGKSNAFERKLPAELIAQFTNDYRFSVVRDIVTNQFGDRAVIIPNEDKLKKNFGVYPKFYSAGWFISQGDNESELIMVEHGNTMEAATKAMLESVKMVNWSELATKIEG